MKRLLLGPALIAPLALFGCNWGTKTPVELPKVPEVVRQIPLDDFEHFPPIVTPEPPKAPSVVKKKTHGPHSRKPAAAAAPAHRPAKALPLPRPPADQAPVETVPQQGPICIFPLNFIPNCTPQEIR
jgi:hypothetical protein